MVGLVDPDEQPAGTIWHCRPTLACAGAQRPGAAVSKPRGQTWVPVASPLAGRAPIRNRLWLTVTRRLELGHGPLLDPEKQEEGQDRREAAQHGNVVPAHAVMAGTIHE
jgi:hypothetical protein